MNSDYDLLLLDFGGVCILNPVELHGEAEQKLGLAAGTLTWMGPIDPSTDALWREMVAGGGITERGYWTQRAEELGLSRREYMSMLYDPPHDGLVRPEARAVTIQALAAGYGVSVLTNDLRAFHGSEWEKGIDLLGLIDHLVDCSDTGILKPDPRAYQRAVDMTGVAADRMLFVDDQPGNVEGAIAFGIDAMWFDVANAATSWQAVADRLSL